MNQRLSQIQLGALSEHWGRGPIRSPIGRGLDPNTQRKRSKFHNDRDKILERCRCISRCRKRINPIIKGVITAFPKVLKLP